MYEQRDTPVPRKHHAESSDRGNWGTTKTRNIHRVVYTFNSFTEKIFIKILHVHDKKPRKHCAIMLSALIIIYAYATWPASLPVNYQDEVLLCRHRLYISVKLENKHNLVCFQTVGLYVDIGELISSA